MRTCLRNMPSSYRIRWEISRTVRILTNSETGGERGTLVVTVNPSSLIVSSATLRSNAVSLLLPARAAVRHVQPGGREVYPGRCTMVYMPG